MTINIFKKHDNKVSDFQIEVIARLESLQNSEARLRQDLREIVKEEIKNVLNERNKKAWWSIA